MKTRNLIFTILTVFAASLLVSCDQKKKRSNEPPKEIQELMAHKKKRDTLVAGFHDEMKRQFPQNEKQPRLSNASQESSAFKALSQEMAELDISEIKVVCRELLSTNGQNPPTNVVRSVGTFKLEKDGSVTQLPNSEAQNTGKSSEEWLKEANESATQRALDRLNPFK